MSLDRVPAGRDLPHDCNVVIEIPMRADPIKYEVDKETGAVFVDRFMSTAMHYPCNYGYIPKTLSGDGDPADVLVLSPVPLMPGVVVRCRPIGMLKMQDEAGSDEKLLAVPVVVVFASIKKCHAALPSWMEEGSASAPRVSCGAEHGSGGSVKRETKAGRTRRKEGLLHA